MTEPDTFLSVKVEVLDQSVRDMVMISGKQVIILRHACEKDIS